MTYDVGDVITYRSDNYSEKYKVEAIEQPYEGQVEQRINISVIEVGGEKQELPRNAGWLTISVFKGCNYSVEKFELPYDPMQQPDEEDDI